MKPSTSGIEAAIEICKWCDKQVAALIPQIGNDEGQPRGKFNPQARSIVAELVRKLATVNWGDMAAEIPIGRIGTAREAVGILVKWRKDLGIQIEKQGRALQRESPKENEPAIGTPIGLNPTQAKAYEIIRSDGPIPGKLLAKKLKVAESSLRRHVVSRLVKHGVRNDRNGHGYYIPGAKNPM